MRRLALFIWASLAQPALADPGLAEPGLAPTELRALSASPEAPRFALDLDTQGWTTARFAAVLPIGDRPRGAGWFGQLVPQLETDGPIIPYLRWRGRLGVEVGYDMPLDRGLLVLRGGLEHESDHRTVEPGTHLRPLQAPVAVVLNNVLLRADWLRPLGGGVLASTAIARVHLLTCTTTAEDCPDGTAGSGTAELTGELLWADRAPILGNFGVFGGFAGTLIGQRKKSGGEARVDLRLGLRQIGRARGHWQIALWSRHGSPVGVERGIVRDETRAGISLGFAR